MKVMSTTESANELASCLEEMARDFRSGRFIVDYVTEGHEISRESVSTRLEISYFDTFKQGQ